MFYHEDFSDSTSGWPNRDSARYSRDGYRLKGQNVVAVNGPAFKEFRAGVSVSVSPAFTGGGLIFRQTGDGFYAVAAFPGTNLRPGFLAAFRVDAAKITELDWWPLISNAAPSQKIEVRCERSDCGVY